LGFADRVSVGGWISRCEGCGKFGHSTVAFFPEIIEPGKRYKVGRKFPVPPHGLHTICATFHQIGIKSFFCSPVVRDKNNPISVEWSAVQLGLPVEQEYQPFPGDLSTFRKRSRKYNFLRYNTAVNDVPCESIPDEFTKENIRIAFSNAYMAETSDVDGILWGERYTYPIEIKEKTVAKDERLGPYFGLDIGPFVKLAFYAAKKGNLHSLFVVREIDDVESRNLVKWWFITYDKLAQYASWVFRGGGKGMSGSQSATVRIPVAEFSELTRETLNCL
jgi:hypothetical protein